MAKENNIIEPGTIYKGFKITIILSLFFSALIILFTMDREALVAALNNTKPIIILVLFAILMVNWLAAGWRLQNLVSILGEKISLADSIIIYLSSSFISNVTPFATGGGPFQVFFLHKKGVKVGKASTVVVIQFLLRIFFLGISSLIFLVFFNWAISPGIIPPYLFYLAFGLGFVFTLTLIIFTLVPGLINQFMVKIFQIKGIREFVKKNRKLKKSLVRARKELKDFRRSLEIIAKYPGKLILSFLLTILYWTSLFLIIPLILIGFGLKPYFFRIYVMQTIFNLVLPFMPTPGASGIAELGFASLFVSYIPKNLIGLTTFLWRFLTFYVVLIVGGFFVLREIGKGKGKNNA